MNKAINILLDWPEDQQLGKFIEIELDNGRSIRIGKWTKRDDGLLSLRITELPKGDK